jgi:threonine dehydrogenase-like Zn-dependent dehydrogenase
LLRGENPYHGADLTYEVSGNPNALDQAVAITGYNGRVVIGSWYGSKEVRLDLGGRFHRSRMRLVSSQVSSVDPELRGRWNKDRLRRLSWNMLNQVKPARFVTHRFHLSGVRAAYELLDKEPGTALQVLLDY